MRPGFLLCVWARWSHISAILVAARYQSASAWITAILWRNRSLSSLPFPISQSLSVLGGWWLYLDHRWHKVVNASLRKSLRFIMEYCDCEAPLKVQLGQESLLLRGRNASLNLASQETLPQASWTAWVFIPQIWCYWIYSVFIFLSLPGHANKHSYPYGP